MCTRDAVLRRAAALLDAFDRVVDAKLHRDQTRRRRVKTMFVALGIGTTLLLADMAMALRLLQVAAQQGPSPVSTQILTWWGPITMVGTALVMGASLRTSFLAHKEYVSAALLEKASIHEMRSIAKKVDELHDDFREYIKEQRSHRHDQGAA